MIVKITIKYNIECDLPENPITYLYLEREYINVNISIILKNSKDSIVDNITIIIFYVL